jgi:hypothetical protein
MLVISDLMVARGQMARPQKRPKPAPILGGMDWADTRLCLLTKAEGARGLAGAPASAQYVTVP